MATKEGLVREIPFRYLKEFIDETSVLRRSSSYRSKEDHVRGLVRALKKEECEFLNAAYSNGVDARSSGKEFCRKIRPKEETVRTRFLEQLTDKAKPEDEAIFCEFSLGANRSDVNRFNGSSYTYELKSPRDSFKRLSNQLDSYSEVFEFVYLVLPEEMSLPENIPDDVGMITYTYPDFHFEQKHEATRIRDQDPEFQLNQLWLEELSELAGEPIPVEGTAEEKKSVLVKAVMEEYSAEEVNDQFKSCIKERYTREGPKEGLLAV